uniref:basic salivary proline-rich protein 2-like n=1 Tax=Nyctereutes procyonoides TaxID=34880 RepID=UPI0024443056|nr:basic salivary proline-rich protein 2-like [Nyctereutes procyonoides]
MPPPSRFLHEPPQGGVGCFWRAQERARLPRATPSALRQAVPPAHAQLPAPFPLPARRLPGAVSRRSHRTRGHGSGTEPLGRRAALTLSPARRRSSSGGAHPGAVILLQRSARHARAVARSARARERRPQEGGAAVAIAKEGGSERARLVRPPLVPAPPPFPSPPPRPEGEPRRGGRRRWRRRRREPAREGPPGPPPPEPPPPPPPPQPPLDEEQQNMAPGPPSSLLGSWRPEPR